MVLRSKTITALFVFIKLKFIQSSSWFYVVKPKRSYYSLQKKRASCSFQKEPRKFAAHRAGRYNYHLFYDIFILIKDFYFNYPYNKRCKYSTLTHACCCFYVVKTKEEGIPRLFPMRRKR